MELDFSKLIETAKKVRAYNGGRPLTFVIGEKTYESLNRNTQEIMQKVCKQCSAEIVFLPEIENDKIIIFQKRGEKWVD